MKIKICVSTIVLLTHLVIAFCQYGMPTEEMHFKNSLELFNNKDLDRSEKEVRKALQIYPEYPEAHNLLAKILAEKKPFLYRLRAELEFKRALENDPNNVDFLIDLGKFYQDHNNPYKSATLFERALELDPDNPRIHYFLALSIDRKGLTNDAIDIANKALEIDPQFNLAQNFLNVVNERHIIFTRAEKDLPFFEPKYFDEALDLDKSYAEIYFSLGYRHFKNENYPKAVEIFNKIAEKIEDHDKSKIFLWLCYQIQGEYEKSRELFDRFRGSLGNRYNFIWQISEMLLPPSETKKYKSLPEEERPDFLKRFWKSRDPLFSSEKSEREIEHYQRIAYAIMQFSSDGIKWDRRGEVWIRFGQPTHIETIPVPPRQIWEYEELGITLKFAKFGDRYELFDFDKGDITLFGRKAIRPNLGIDDIGWVAEFLAERSQLAKYKEVAEKTPEFYMFDYGGDAFRIPYYKADYIGASLKTSSEFYYGIPAYYFYTGDSEPIKIDNAVVIFDENWHEVYKNISEDELTTTPQNQGNIDSLVVFKSETELPPGNYFVSIELHDKKSGNIGLVREKIVIKKFEENDLSISDVMLAMDMSGAEEEGLFTKDGINIYPHPAKQFNKNIPLYVYFEIYNLKLNRNGRTKFEVSTIVTEYKDDKSGLSNIFAKAASFLGLKKVKGLIESKYPYDGTSKNENLHFGIDASKLNPGLYTLIIELKDKYSGKNIRRKQNFLLY